MKIIRGLDNIPSFSTQTVLAIGNFDGIHLGHQKILHFLHQRAKQLHFPSSVVIFSPHPQNVLGKDKISMIQTTDQKIESIKKFQIDTLFIIHFDLHFAQVSATDFVVDILINTLHAKEIVVGDNFFFGKNREGNIDTLHTLCPSHGFRIFPIPSVLKNGEIVSSSKIRQYLEAGAIEKANILLGRPYRISGHVIKGRSKGRTLGFPTANIHTSNELLPLGVYLTRTEVKGKLFPSLTNIGTNPTFQQDKTHIETYLIGLDQDLYGEELEICFLKKLRNEIRFDSPEELKQQIELDLQHAKSYLINKPCE
jgi:riboflavin kinase/FMN adenylyltransferase